MPEHARLSSIRHRETPHGSVLLPGNYSAGPCEGGKQVSGITGDRSGGLEALAGLRVVLLLVDGSTQGILPGLQLGALFEGQTMP